MNMRGKISVTEHKPVIVAILCELPHCMIGVISYTPTMCFIDNAGQCVGDDIKIRRNMQTVKLAIISCVTNNGNLVLRNNLHQPL